MPHRIRNPKIMILVLWKLRVLHKLISGPYTYTYTLYIYVSTLMEVL